MSITASLGHSFTSAVAHTTHLPSRLPRVGGRQDRPATERVTAIRDRPTATPATPAVPVAGTVLAPVRAESVRLVDVATTMARHRSHPDPHAATRALTTSITR